MPKTLPKGNNTRDKGLHQKTSAGRSRGQWRTPASRDARRGLARYKGREPLPSRKDVACGPEEEPSAPVYS